MESETSYPNKTESQVADSISPGNALLARIPSPVEPKEDDREVR